MRLRMMRSMGVAIVASAALIATACSGPSDDTTAATSNANCEKTDTVRVVLQWVAQSQFAGYYAAKDKGYYADQCLDVKIQEGGVNVVPQQILASGNAEFAVSHVTKSMATREQGADLVNISQIFQRGAYLQVSWADSGIKTLADLKGKKVGSWGYGNELVLFAAMRAAGVDPTKDTTIVQQPFDMSLLLKREVDAAQAKTYNEYAQLLESENPKTGKLYQPSDFNAINLQDLGYASLEDGVYARGDWLSESKNQDISQRFLAATMKGWAFCRDKLDECVETVLDNGAALGKGHMTWQLNEVNKLIWPSANGIGAMDAKAWEQTIKNAIAGGALKNEPADGAFRTDLNTKAQELAAKDGVDIKGADYKPETVEVTAGGK